MKRFKTLLVLVLCFIPCLVFLFACGNTKENAPEYNKFYLARAEIKDDNYVFEFNYKYNSNINITYSELALCSIDPISGKLTNHTYSINGYSTTLITHSSIITVTIMISSTDLDNNQNLINKNIELQFRNKTNGDSTSDYENMPILYSQSFPIRTLIQAAESGKYTIDYAFGSH